MVPTRISSFVKSSNSMFGRIGLAFIVGFFVCLLCIEQLLYLCLDSSVFDLFEQQFRFVQLMSYRKQVIFPVQTIRNYPCSAFAEFFRAERQRTGRKAMARLATSCREMLRMVPTRSISVLASFHGSVSARYLLPIRARFMASFCASRNLNTSSSFSLLLLRLQILSAFPLS